MEPITGSYKIELTKEEQLELLKELYEKQRKLAELASNAQKAISEILFELYLIKNSKLWVTQIKTS